MIWTLILMAAALGMDAFSLGIGIGMKGIRITNILQISLLIGLFHIMMPLTGMFTGHYVGSILGNVAVAAGGGLLVFLGIHMIYSCLKGEEVRSFDYRTFLGMMAFALSVSIDSFSVGVSMGLFASDIALTVLMFGLFGGGMSILGLYLGKSFSSSLGDFGEAVGGVILLLFGIKFLL